MEVAQFSSSRITGDSNDEGAGDSLVWSFWNGQVVFERINLDWIHLHELKKETGG